MHDAIGATQENGPHLAGRRSHKAGFDQAAGSRR